MPTIVFNHGWDGYTAASQFGPIEWTKAVNLAHDKGYNTVIPSLGNENVENAHIIEEAINALPQDEEVFIVAHSMGCLSTRHYLKYFGGKDRVKVHVAIDGPQFGADKAWYMNWQMLPNSQFLHFLNAEPATPGPVIYVQLAHDYNTPLPEAWFETFINAQGMTHRNMVTNDGVLNQVFSALNEDFSNLVWL